MLKNDSRPDFLGIGAQKAATNWIWHNLKQHPDIWMPPIKELHYFDRSPKYPSPSYLHSARLSHRLFGKERHNAEFRRLFIRKLASLAFKRNWSELRWHLKHFVGYYDDDWYFSLFDEGRGRMKGEITPSYSILDLQDVQAIQRLLPDLKILLILRNPIDRAWSHVRFDWTRNWFHDIDSIAGIKAFIDSPKQRLRGDYLRTIDTWLECYPAQQIFICFYDDILQDPAKLLNDVYRFLGVRPAPEQSGNGMQDKKNVSGKKDIPDAVLLYLAEAYRADIERLHERFGGHATAWRAETIEILQQLSEDAPRKGV